MTGWALPRRRWADRRGARLGALAALLALPTSGLALHALSPGAAPLTRPTLETPAQALGRISSALGAADPGYRFAASAGRAAARNPSQRLRLTATTDGVTIGAKRLDLSLSLRAVGLAGALRPVDRAVPVTRANRLSYGRPGVAEWYVNGPAGLEQGFTIARSPAGDRTRPLTIALRLAGSARAAIAAHGSAVAFTGGRGQALRYDSLAATDAGGHALPVSMTLRGRELLLRVKASGARYPVTIDPLLHEQAEAKLTGGEEAGEGRFGYSVALSADGNTALVGGPLDGAYGAVWAFVREGGQWRQQGPKLQGGERSGAPEACGQEAGEEGEECNFGRSVALSGDGNTAIVGNPRESRLEPPVEPGGQPTLRRNVGAAWVYTRSGGTWRFAARVTGGEEGGEGRFGKSVALSGDGQTAIVGGPSDRNHGSVWIFTRSGEEWTQQGPKLSPSDEQGEGYFGLSVALSGDGHTAIVGAPGDAGFTGAAWIFSFGEGIWFQHGGKLTGAGESGAGRFGYSVALSGDGGTALVGGRSDAEGAGAAWVFARNGSDWVPQGAKLTGQGEGEGAQAFGYSVALSHDGSTALVGAPHEGASSGAAWQFQRSGETWSAARELEAGISQLGHHEWFGASVALSADGSTRLVGGPNDGDLVGAAWVFGLSPAVTGVSPHQGPRAGGTEVTITGSNFVGATAVRFGAAAAARFTVVSPEAITATTPPGEGAVDVTVSSPDGTSLPGVKFTYVAGKAGGGSTSGGGATSGATASGPATVTVGVGGVLGFASGTCRVALVSRRVSVQAHARAAFRLRASGAGPCRGKLRLRVRRRISPKRTSLQTIGTARFSIPAGRSAIVEVKLNRTGVGVFERHHWSLRANLLLVRQSPVPALAQTASVHLALAPVKRAPHG